MTEDEQVEQVEEEGPVVDPDPEGGIGGDESEHIPVDDQPPPTDVGEDEGGGEAEADPDGPTTHVFESLGDAPVDEGIPEDEGDAGEVKPGGGS